MRHAKRLAIVGQITSMRLQAIQLEMAQLLEREGALRRNIEQLMEGRRSSLSHLGNDKDAAVVAGAAIRWHRWVDQRRTVINTELAQVLAQKLELRKRLHSAFGKDQVVQALSKHESAQTRQAALRRANYVS